MATNKWYTEKILVKIDDNMKEKLQLVGEVVSSDAKRNAPVDTGTLRDSITFEVDDGEQMVTIGTNVEYAIFQELGTRYIHPKFFLTRAVQENINKIKTIFAKEIK